MVSEGEFNPEYTQTLDGRPGSSVTRTSWAQAGDPSSRDVRTSVPPAANATRPTRLPGEAPPETCPARSLLGATGALPEAEIGRKPIMNVRFDFGDIRQVEPAVDVPDEIGGHAVD